MEKEKLSICFLHPDLGLGGAEMLVVETAVAMKKRGHYVEVYTSYHDPKRCFRETIDGTLDVHVHDSIFPRSIFGRFVLPLANIRFFWTSMKVMMRHKNLPGGYDIIFVDQIPSTVPLLKISGARVIYYCHFPDLLLTMRNNFFKKLYRLPLDYLEEITTKTADIILVNSKFTFSVFKNTFKSIKTNPFVVYPTVNHERVSIGKNQPSLALENQTYILSLNRYERKKNIILAIETVAIILQKLVGQERKNFKLFIAGGYDERVVENIEHLKELKLRVKQLEIDENVVFFTKVDDLQRNSLLWNCKLVLYTPPNEHFGIVPLEAAAAYKPVIACNSGGPLESILDGVTGYLIPPVPKLWAEKILEITQSEQKLKTMGEAAFKFVVEKFSPSVQIAQLEEIFYSFLSRERLIY